MSKDALARRRMAKIAVAGAATMAMLTVAGCSGGGNATTPSEGGGDVTIASGFETPGRFGSSACADIAPVIASSGSMQIEAKAFIRQR